MSRFVILSGCSGGGKSTLLDALAERGFAVVPEPGRRIVAKELALGRAAALRPDKALAALRSAPTLWAAVRGSAALGRAAASFDAIAPLAAIMVFLSRRGARRQRQHRQGCNGLFHGRRLFPPPRRGSPTVSSQLGNAAHL